jgi:predicted RNase H-like nuclease (RuvC/YqgF family)
VQAERGKTDQLAEHRENRELEEAKEQIATLQKELEEAQGNDSNVSRIKAKGGADASTLKALTQDLDRQLKQVCTSLCLSLSRADSISTASTSHH